MRAFELKAPKNQLVIFDIDDTLLHTTAKINVVKDGRVVRSLTNQEFNNYKLQPGEEFDFGEFRNARKFEEESIPIGPMLDKLRSDLAAGHDVVMLTASDLDVTLIAKVVPEEVAEVGSTCVLGSTFDRLIG